MQIIFQEGLEL